MPTGAGLSIFNGRSAFSFSIRNITKTQNSSKTKKKKGVRLDISSLLFCGNWIINSGSLFSIRCIKQENKKKKLTFTDLVKERL